MILLAEAPEAQDKKKKGRGGLIAAIVLVLLLGGAGAGWYFLKVKPANAYKAADAMREEGRFDDAIAAFEALGDYEDAAEQVKACLEQKTVAAVQAGDYSLAKQSLDRLGRDSKAVQEAVDGAFRKELEKLSAAGLGELLDKLASCVSDKSACIGLIRGKMEELFAKGEEDRAESLEAAAAALDAGGLLLDAAEENMKACMASGAYDRANVLLAKYGERTEKLAETVRYHVRTALASGDLDGTLKMIAAFSGTSLNFDEENYSIGISMINAGEYEKATVIFAALGDYENSKEMLQEIQYRILNSRLTERMSQGTELLPDEFAAFYRELQEMGDYGKSREARQNLLHAWIDTSLSTNSAAPYLDALTKTAELSADDKEDLLVYIMKNTPVMAEVKDDKTVWYCTEEEMKDYRMLMDVLFKDSKDIRAQGFLHFMDYLASKMQTVTSLPSNEEIKALWDLRPDMLDFCKTGDPLLMFLMGRWEAAADSGKTIEVTRKDDGYFFIAYHLPTDEVNVYVEASLFGLNSFDPYRTNVREHVVKRVCTIEIADFDTIKVYNDFDDTFYTLTRVNK